MMDDDEDDGGNTHSFSQLVLKTMWTDGIGRLRLDRDEWGATLYQRNKCALHSSRSFHTHC